jgi:nucleoside-diphosphate-sugar epimerase
MRVAITGAAGRIGSQLVDELSSDHELRLIDRRPSPNRRCWRIDLARAPSHQGWVSRFTTKSGRWSEALKGCDVVVHLAANMESLAPWEKILPDNIQGTWNMIEAAAAHGVSRVVFASSNWAVKGTEYSLAPGCYLPGGPKIPFDAPPSPVNPYGTSKAFGEIIGRMFVDEGRLRSFIAVRIGNYNPSPSTDEIVRARWIGVDDIRSLFRRCVEADLEGFHVVYGVSAQKTAPYDLSHTCQLLSWCPRQLPDHRQVPSDRTA